MDYCSSCRRHLNGALVCPGCGAYAPDIAPAPLPTRAAAPYTPPPPEEPTSPTPLTPPLAHGRAARRRQLARLKKSQRRAVLATAVALVGGGLTLSTMDRGGSGDRAQAATAPETPTGMGGTDVELTEPPTTPRTTEPTQPDTPTTPSTPTTPAQRTAPPEGSDPRPQTQNTPPPSTTTKTPPPPATTPAPAPPETTPPPTTPTTPPPTQQPQPPDDRTNDDKLCLLVICLGG
ncbi:hypothetical protein ABZX40_15920 [Streptomyces sp. NPDC004610]|uniref:SCO2400 family protein n=1 Tax=unclassified Streptomyces TaxID=2593676 RepID=UPI0033A24137